MTFWTYMLHCTGHCEDLEVRLAQHSSGDQEGFASSHSRFKLVWSQEFATRLEALEAEQRIKGWSRAKKLALIRGDWARISALAKGKGSPSTSLGTNGV